MIIVQRRVVPAICSYVCSERGNADKTMWRRHVKTVEIMPVVSYNDISAESDVLYSYLKVDELYLPPCVVASASFCST
jgi:hypothetical protein